MKSFSENNFWYAIFKHLFIVTSMVFNAEEEFTIRIISSCILWHKLHTSSVPDKDSADVLKMAKKREEAI